ncbi:MAG TPA: AMIN domain-containing protein [bacterium]|nr:AMIN domain-containing protein [bacterium]
MKKLGYVVVLILCLAAGLGIGKFRQHKHGGAANGGDGVEIGAPKNPGVPNLGDLTANAGSAASNPAAAGAAAAATAADAGTAAAGSAAAAVTSTPEPAPTQVADASTDPTGGRSFAAGANPDPVKSSSSGGGSTGGHKRTRGTQVIDSGSSDSGMGSSSGSASSDSGSSSSSPSTWGNTSENPGEEHFDNPPPTPKPVKAGKTGKTKVAAAEPPPPPPPASSGDIGDLPVIDDPAPPPAGKQAPPVAQQTQVAMINNSSVGDLTFPGGGSGAALKRISQRQNGDKTVVHIERSGGAKFRVFKLKNPNRVWVDFEETEVPGGDPTPVAGSNHVKEISARYIKNSGGGIPTARVQIVLSDDKIPNVECADAGGGVDCTIGGAAEKF